VSGYDTVQRAGRYLRVIAPDWVDPLDTAYSKRTGGALERSWCIWRAITSAPTCMSQQRMPARAMLAGRLKLFDLRPEARPQLVTVGVPRATSSMHGPRAASARLVLQRVSRMKSLGCLAKRSRTRRTSPGSLGVAARSNAEATPTRYVGEELAVFEGTDVRDLLERQQFAQWYPDPIPE